MKTHSTSRWCSLEFSFYYLYTIFYFGIILDKAIIISAEYGSENWRPWLPGLRKGWIPGTTLIDVSDAQWRNFREGLPILMSAMAALTIPSLLVRRAVTRNCASHVILSAYWLLVSLSYVTYLHGACIVFLLGLASLNFLLVKAMAGSSFFPAILWLFNGGVLILNRVYDGYSFHSISPKLSFLDGHRGIFRWQICYNLVMLRMVSFGMDSHWTIQKRPSGVRQNHEKTCDVCRAGQECYNIRQEAGVTSSGVLSSCVDYFSYLLFAPLYIAGPTLTFNAFVSQMKSPQHSLTWRQVAAYGARWLLCLLLMELISHFCFFPALAASGLWQQMEPLSICVIGYGVLNVMWLKFLLIWRFFRFWSLAAGVECPENMQRCVNNNYDIEGFWKGWHSSYNRWLVRYVYVPLGGASWRALNIWIIFTFVALWHDIEWKLLSWAWITCLIALPELVAKSFMRSKWVEPWREKWFYREICAVGGAFSIAGLMCANLVGFVVGVSGIKIFLEKLLKWQNSVLICNIFFSFYVGTKLMLEIRNARCPVKRTSNNGPAFNDSSYLVSEVLQVEPPLQSMKRD